MLAPMLIAAIITSGLLAGFFFAYWCSVMIGLRKVSDATFVETMQEINASLPNARFAIPFFAPVVLTAISTWLAFAGDESTAAWWSAGATILAVITFGITASQNVPMNNTLAEAGRSDDSAAREAFEIPWTRWNDIRTLTSTLTFVASVMALFSLD